MIYIYFNIKDCLRGEMMDSTLIANINDATATSEFLKSQRDLVESVYKNDNSYLSQAKQ